jgi:DNA primase catalytic core
MGDNMGRIPEETIEKIIEQSDIVNVVSEFVQLKKSGRGYSGVCPFHNDKGPSLSVSPEKQLYHCFGCGASGNVVGFIMKIRNLDFIDAIEYLADKAGIKIVEESIDPQRAKEDALREKIYKLNIETAKYYYSNLKNNKAPQEYFENRGVDERIIKKFGLGFSSDSWDRLLNYLVSKDDLEEVKHINSTEPVIIFEKAAIANDYKTILKYKDQVELDPRRESLVVDAYIALNKLDEGIEFANSKGNKDLKNKIEDIKNTKGPLSSNQTNQSEILPQ